MPVEERKRKPHSKTKLYSHKTQKTGPQPWSSAVKPKKYNRSNLTLHDWLAVVAYYNAHQPISQPEVVKYFATRPEGILIFDQSSLSRHISTKGWRDDQAWLNSNPTALSAKRVRVVTRPDVERALVLWVKHMEDKQEHVSGPMLVTKRRKFEELLGVPEEERMHSDGWVANFCKT
jgi:hypothetical protein